MPRHSANHKTDGSDSLIVADIKFHLDSIKNKSNRLAIVEVKLHDKAMTKKSVLTEVLLRYLANPSNDWPKRNFLSINICGLRSGSSIYQIFSSDELHDIEQEALRMRRKRYSKELSLVDKAMFKKAQAGDTAAARIVYERFEGMVEEKSGNHNTTASEMLMTLMETFTSRKALNITGSTEIVEIEYEPSSD